MSKFGRQEHKERRIGVRQVIALVCRSCRERRPRHTTRPACFARLGYGSLPTCYFSPGQQISSQVESTPHNPSMFPFLYCLFISWATFHPPSRLPLCRDSRPDFCWQWGFLVCVVILCNERLRLGQFVLFIFSWHCLTQTLKNSPLTEKWRGVYQIKSEQDSWQIKSKNFPILSLSMHRIHTHTHTKKPRCQQTSAEDWQKRSDGFVYIISAFILLWVVTPFKTVILRLPSALNYCRGHWGRELVIPTPMAAMVRD